MRWVAPTEKDAANETLEKRLCAAADQQRANSGLECGQYSMRVLAWDAASAIAELRCRSHVGEPEE